MSASFKVAIPGQAWQPIEQAPRDGSLMFVRDSHGNVDLVEYDTDGWNAELGTLEDMVSFARISIATLPDHNGMCGRCGRYRKGP